MANLESALGMNRDQGTIWRNGEEGPGWFVIAFLTGFRPATSSVWEGIASSAKWQRPRQPMFLQLKQTARKRFLGVGAAVVFLIFSS
jgi:hypothetical protein